MEDMKLSDAELINCLNKHPDLKVQVNRLICVAEATSGTSERADDVEIQIRNELIELGRRTLNDWATTHEAHRTALAADNEKLKKHGKKNSIGTQHLV